MLGGSVPQEVSKLIWYPKELDPDLLLGGHTSIAMQTLCPGETNMRPLRPRKDYGQRRETALVWWLLDQTHFEVLITHDLHTGTPVHPSAPIPPE